MVYILGHRPDEFGLVPERDGFVTFKELLWAIHEEPGWGFVRQSQINEVLLGKDRTRFQAEDNRIRVLDTRWSIDLEEPCRILPKILFSAIRRRAHPHVMEKGLKSIENRYIVLSPDREIVKRIGRRRDQKPVLLEIMAFAAQEKGVPFHTFGSLFLANEVPPGYINGPPVSKQVVKASEEAAREKPKTEHDFEAGTFVLDVTRGHDQSQRAKGKKRRGWKEDARKLRKRKRGR